MLESWEQLQAQQTTELSGTCTSLIISDVYNGVITARAVLGTRNSRLDSSAGGTS